MNTDSIKMITRVALFAALIYVLSWGTAYIPNVNPIFFIIFLAGYMWGLIPGLLVGAVGMGLWTILNPFGPAALPITIAQIIGASFSGVVGTWFYQFSKKYQSNWSRYTALVISSALCTLGYFILVNASDAWIFQPFWPRFISSFAWSLLSFLSNMVIFPLLFKTLSGFLKREMSR